MNPKLRLGDYMYGSIGMNLKMLRLKKRQTQKHVAESTGLSFRTISCYERNINIPKRSNLEKLAEFYGVSVEEISEKIK